MRNEAFTEGKREEFIYPPNEFGWNPNNQELPLNIQKLQEYLNQGEEEEELSLSQRIKKNKNYLISFGIPLAVFTIMYYTMKYKAKIK